MHQKNAPKTAAGLVSFEVGGAGYMSNSDRFHSDTAGEEFQQRQVDAKKRLDAIEYRRNKAQQREDDRLALYNSRTEAEEERIRGLRMSETAGKKNRSAVAYDITTTQYNQDMDGVQQKYVDDMVRYRAKVRTLELSRLAGSRASYDILNGQEKEVCFFCSSSF